MRVRCQNHACLRTFDKPRNYYSRTEVRGGGHYCGKPCSQTARRVFGPEMSDDMKRARKATYDREYQSKNRDRLRAEKRAYYQANKAQLYAKHSARMKSDPVYRNKYKAAQARCQARPEWKARKAKYDRRYRAEREYGEWADAYLTLLDLDEEVEAAEPSFVALAIAKGNLNKKQTRRREWESDPN